MGQKYRILYHFQWLLLLVYPPLKEILISSFKSLPPPPNKNITNIIENHKIKKLSSKQINDNNNNNNNNNNNSFINLLERLFSLIYNVRYLKLSFPKKSLKKCCFIFTLSTSKLVIDWNSSGRLFHSFFQLDVWNIRISHILIVLPLHVKNKSQYISEGTS